jgi:hypothetical protein
VGAAEVAAYAAESAFGSEVGLELSVEALE